MDDQDCPARPTRGLAFSTFAVPTIVGEIRRHFRDRTWSVHVQRALQERTGRVERCVRELTQELGRAPSVRELAARATLSDEDELEALRCSAAYRTMSLDMPVSEDTTLGGLLGGEDKAYDDVDLRESLTAMFARLPERERRILRLRFFGNMIQSQPRTAWASPRCTSPACSAGPSPGSARSSSAPTSPDRGPAVASRSRTVHTGTRAPCSPRHTHAAARRSSTAARRSRRATPVTLALGS